MNLSVTAKEFAEGLYNERLEPAWEEHRAKARKLEWEPNHSLKFGLLASEQLQYTKQRLSIRVQSYIEAFDRIDQYPDEEDFQKCAHELVLMAEAQGNLFNFRFFKGPLCSIPTNLVDRRLEILTLELRQLPPQALLPLRRLVSEGKMMADRESADHRTTRLSIDDVDAIELKPNFFGIGLNLNHLIKRLGHWRTKRKSQSV